jgi:NTP pyrophosphatase (non-canonical NTP hydrolase)
MNETDQEILVIAQEECAEVIQEISKCFRFGIDRMHKTGLLHRQVLTEEVGDLLCMLQLMQDYNIVNPEEVEVARVAKLKKLQEFSNIFKK